MIEYLHRPISRLMLCASVALAAAGCDQLVVEPAANPGTIALSLSPSAPDFAVAPASANRVRVQVHGDGTVLLDTIFAFDPESEELLFPVRFAGSVASADIRVEIGEDGRPLLRGSAEVVLRQRRVVDAEVRLVGADVAPLGSVSALTSGIYHSCATAGEAGLFCWGNNDEGQLGTGKFSPSPLAVAIEGSGGLYSIAAGFLTTCGLAFGGDAFCWGDNEYGSLGSGDSPPRSAVPVAVASEVNFNSITVGGLHACGLGSEGEAYCWGFNGFGQLGDGTTTDRSTPVRVAVDATFRSISAGYIHTCGITTAGQVLCWGLNEFGQLGDGSTVDRSIPGAVGGQRQFTEVSSGGLHTCALTEAGEAFCWGFNDFGQLGNGTTQEVLQPLSVGEMRFASLSAGGLHTCGVSTEGAGYCWGYNGSGALGDDTLQDSAFPVLVEGGYSFGLIRSGLHHTCGAVVQEGRVVCWGYNRFGQLGDGSRLNRPEPVDVLRGQPFFLEEGDGQIEVNEAVAALLEGTIAL